MMSQEDMNQDLKEKESDGSGNSDDPLACGMYEEEFPSVGDIIVVEVSRIADSGIYCKLLEYNNIEGLLLWKNFQKRRLRSKRAIKPGQHEMVEVISVNEEKSYIDLSRKSVTPEDKESAHLRWNSSKTVHSIMRYICAITGKKVKHPINGEMVLITKYTVKQLYQLFGWRLAKEFGHCYDGFKWAALNWDKFLEKYDQIPKDIQIPLYDTIKKKFKPKWVTIRSDIELTCFTSDGVDTIKKALKSGLALSEGVLSNEDSNSFEFTIKAIGPPMFGICINTLECQQDKGEKLVKQIVSEICDTIRKYGGECVVQTEARVTAMDINNK